MWLEGKENGLFEDHNAAMDQRVKRISDLTASYSDHDATMDQGVKSVHDLLAGYRGPVMLMMDHGVKLVSDC